MRFPASVVRDFRGIQRNFDWLSTKFLSSTSVAPAGNWVNYGAGFADLRVKRNGGVVYIAGVITKTIAVVPAELITVLPYKASKNGIVSIMTHGDAGAGRVDVDTLGNLSYQLGGTTGGGGAGGAKFLCINGTFEID